MEKEIKVYKSKLATILGSSAIGIGALGIVIGGAEVVQKDFSDGITTTIQSFLPLAVGVEVLLSDHLRAQKKKSLEEIIAMNRSNNPNIIEGEYRIIEPSEPQSLEQG